MTDSPHDQQPGPPVQNAGPVPAFVTDLAPKDYQRPDLLVLDDVAHQLAGDPTLEARDVEIACADGKVTVAGTVPRHDDKFRVEAIAASTFGVVDVDIENLQVHRELEAPDPEVLIEQSAGTSHETLAARPPAEATARPERPRRRKGGGNHEH